MSKILTPWFSKQLLRGISLLLLVVLLVPFQPQPVSASQRVVSPPGHSDRILRLKFIEGADTDNLSTLLPPSAWQIIQKIDPLFTLPKSLLKELKNRGSERLRKDKGENAPPLPDLGLWYEVLLSQGVDSDAAVALLSALPAVEQVSPAALMPPPPSTGDYTGLQGYLGSASAGVDAEYAWTKSFGAGMGITIYDVEYGWIQDHEDLSKAASAPLLLNPGDSIVAFEVHHGTAVLGEMIADKNGFGVTGIAYDANLKLAPANTANLGWNPANAILLSAADGYPGDVILVEQQTYVCGLPGGLGPSEYDLAVFQVIQTATALGFVVVEAAGNGGVDLDQSACQGKFNISTRDSGAILVGAGKPPASGFDRQREVHPTWASSYGSRVDMQGWGSMVMTTGIGDYPDPNAWLDPQYMYTNTFNGTSSASPMVAASAAIIQAAALSLTGEPLSPWQVRDLLVSTGSPQLGNLAEKIGPRPNLRQALTNIPQSPSYMTVNIGGSQNDHQCTVTDCSLVEAIELANTDDIVSVINLAQGATYILTTVNATDETYGAAGLPLIDSPLTIYGRGATLERSSAGGTPEFRLLQVTSRGDLTLYDMTLRDGNLAGKPGGALLNLGTTTVNSSTFTGNNAGDGGALANTGTLTVINSTLAYNSASGNGAGVWSSGSLALTGVTMAGNNAAGASLTASGSALVRNTLMVKGASGANCSGVLGGGSTSNMADDTSCGPSSMSKTTEQIKLGALASNGGSTQTIALLPGSLAIDAGSATACQASGDCYADQRSYYRFADGNGNGIKECDIGAYEVASTPILPQAPGPFSPPPQVQVVLDPASPDGSNGWYRSTPLVKVEAIDNSGVIEVRCALNSDVLLEVYTDLPETACPFVGGSAVSADGIHLLVAAAMNMNGKKSSPVSISFQIDTTPPAITCPAGGPFLLNSGDHLISPSGVDASVSGLDEAASTLSGSISTTSIGSRHLTFTAADLAGNSTSLECNYSVIYNFGGFYPPVTPAPIQNPLNAGSAIPLKFSLAGNQGLDIIAQNFPTFQPVDCQTLTQIGDPVPAAPAGRSSLSYNPLTGWYNTIWKTEKDWAGTCRLLTLKLLDGTRHLAYFDFH